MAYDTQKLLDQAVRIAVKHQCFFLEQVISHLGCSKNAFYNHFPVDSNEYDLIKTEVDKNKIAVKQKMQKKWYKSDNATLQVALYKLLGTEEEAHRLNGSKTHNTHTVDEEVQQMLKPFKEKKPQAKQDATGTTD